VIERLLLAAVLLTAAVAVAWFLERRRKAGGYEAPTQPTGFTLPGQLDRSDFRLPDSPTLVVVFTSATCDSCAETVMKAKALEGPSVAYEEVPWQTRRDLHDRYGIEVVPATLIADAQGVVTASFIGRPPATDLWNALGA
jgi:hypothetical protein